MRAAQQQVAGNHAAHRRGRTVLGFSSAFRAFVNRLRLPRQRGHNANALVAVDLAERPSVAARSPEGDQSVVATLTARIETMESEFARVEAAAAVHRADFERERERCERLMAGGTDGCPGSNSTDCWRTRGLQSAAVVAPAGRLSGGHLTAGGRHLDYSR